MSNPQKRRGDAAEREVAGILTDLLGVACRRELGAGRRDDMGDIRLPNTVIQVASYENIADAIRLKVPASEVQRANANVSFAATFLRRRGGSYVVVQTVEQWAAMWREATA